MKNENDKSVFDFWLLYEKVVSKLPEKIVENSESNLLKKAIIDGGMADVSFNSVSLPFTNKVKQEESFRNMVDILIITNKVKEFDYDQYYNQYLEKQQKQNKDLPLTDFVQILIDEGKIPAIDYKEYEEKILSKRMNTEKILGNINSSRININVDNSIKTNSLSGKNMK